MDFLKIPFLLQTIGNLINYHSGSTRVSPMHTMIAFLGLNFVILLGSPKIPGKNALSLLLVFKSGTKHLFRLFKAKINSLFLGKRRLRILMGGTKCNQCKKPIKVEVF